MVKTVLRYLALGAVGVTTVGVGMMLSPLVRPVNPNASVVFENGKLIGHTRGYVRDIDPRTNTIRVSSNCSASARSP